MFSSARFLQTVNAKVAGSAVRRAQYFSEGCRAPREGIEWNKLGFALATKESNMIVSTCHSGEMWASAKSFPYGPLPIEPAATVVNYGQGIFEGIKAYRTERDRIVLFRPEMNAHRFSDGARRMLMPPVPTSLFLQACGMAVRENVDLVPPVGEGALYLRPLLFGSGPDLGVKPSSEYTFLTFVSPVGRYFGAGTSGARMQICMDHHRAAPMGVGHVKYIGNYAQCFMAQADAKANGFSDVVYTDVGGQYIDEGAASNFFCVTEDSVVHTPHLGTILPGITRDSVVQLLRHATDAGIKLKVGHVSLDTALRASEAFLTGTGAGITPVEHISTDEDSVDFACPGPITQMLSKMLSDIQLERAADTMGWLHDPFSQTTWSMSSVVEP